MSINRQRYRDKDYRNGDRDRETETPRPGQRDRQTWTNRDIKRELSFVM